MQVQQLSEHPENTSKSLSLVEELKEKVQLPDSEEISQKPTDERDEKDVMNGGGDDDQDEEELVADNTTSSNFRSRLRKILLFFVAVWLAWAVLRSFTKPRSKVVYANRYSEDFKFRPAASPIVTETLKDGRTRIRGAEPTGRTMSPQRYGPKSREEKEKESKPRRRRSRKRKPSGRK